MNYGYLHFIRKQASATDTLISSEEGRHRDERTVENIKSGQIVNSCGPRVQSTGREGRGKGLRVVLEDDPEGGVEKGNRMAGTGGQEKGHAIANGRT